ncbi:hypothetical protein, partial [Stenotrophomonas maltophilia group sp. RNC7]|uniref:hypothetical protein n=1 Tax=Stenotrophomonas maltophilia group sp. RNC7 TaxID=3071467 RepID=UPI0027DF7E87
LGSGLLRRRELWYRLISPALAIQPSGGVFRVFWIFTAAFVSVTAGAFKNCLQINPLTSRLECFEGLALSCAAWKDWPKLLFEFGLEIGFGRNI